MIFSKRLASTLSWKALMANLATGAKDALFLALIQWGILWLYKGLEMHQQWRGDVMGRGLEVFLSHALQEGDRLWHLWFYGSYHVLNLYYPVWHAALLSLPSLKLAVLLSTVLWLFLVLVTGLFSIAVWLFVYRWVIRQMDRLVFKGLRPLSASMSKQWDRLYLSKITSAMLITLALLKWVL